MSGVQEASGNEIVCVVCFKDVEIFSLGLCNHPVCYECSTRMRVLCRQNECPICRQDMPKVIFTKTKAPFSELITQFEKTNLQDRKSGIIFCSSDIQKAYYKILEHHCFICKSDKKWPFRTFQQLQDHMRKEHELYYCDICVDNLKIFTSERRCYTRQELAHHRRKGDLNDTSHRGHPLCEFCDKRFVDNDDLFRHLRKIHHYCHFCDADGKNQYYMNLDDLFAHFEDEHYICRESECKLDPFTSVFRSKIDLQGHIAIEHSRNMTKLATKQARTLDLEFPLAPRSDVRSRQARVLREIEEFERLSHNNASQSVQFDPSSAQDFPALAGNNNNSVSLRSVPSSNSKTFSQQSSSNLKRENFPTLGGNRNGVTPSNSYPTLPKPTVTSNASLNAYLTLPKPSSLAPSASSVLTNARSAQQKAHKPQKPPEKSKSSKPSKKVEELDDFPALATCKTNGTTTTFRINTPNSIPPKVSLVKANHQPAPTSKSHSSFNNVHNGFEPFPSLGEPAKIAKPQWVQGKSKKKSEAKKEPAPAPDLPSNSLEQYPSLKGKNTKSKSAASSNVKPKDNCSNEDGKNQKYSEEHRRIGTGALISSSKSHNGSEKKSKQESKKNVVPSENLAEFPALQLKKQKSKVSIQTSDNESNKNVSINKSNLKMQRVVQNKNKKSSEMESQPNSMVSTNQDYTKPKTSMSDIFLNRAEQIEKTNDTLILTKPPPGFNVKPPPGFDLSSFPSLDRATSALTLEPVSDLAKFYPPSNFQNRNNRLIKKVLEATDNNTIREFKTKSDAFRNDNLSVEKYYKHCKTCLGAHFEDVFPELLVLLPDKQKQQELYSMYDGRNKKNIVICEQCKQVIFSKELGEHYYCHLLDNQFPTLSSNGGQESSAWNK